MSKEMSPKALSWNTRSRESWRVGAAAWVLVGPLFLLAQLLVQAAWSTPFSWARNNISDLGNARCQAWGDDTRYVCSPLHALMNAAFAGTGVIMLVGMVLLWTRPQLGRSRLAQVLIGLAAAGYLVAGLAPADQHENLHVVLGAVPIFFAGNLGLLRLAVARTALPIIRLSALLAGGIGLTATVLFLVHHDLGLGLGGIERVAALPLHGFLLFAGWRLFAGRAGQHEAGAQYVTPGYL